VGDAEVMKGRPERAVEETVEIQPVLPFLCPILPDAITIAAGGRSTALVAAVGARCGECPARPRHLLSVLRRLPAGQAASRTARARAEAGLRARGTAADEARAAGQALRVAAAAGDRADHRAGRAGATHRGHR